VRSPRKPTPPTHPPHTPPLTCVSPAGVEWAPPVHPGGGGGGTSHLTCGLVQRVDQVAYSAVWRQARVVIGMAFVLQRTYSGPVYKDAFNGTTLERVPVCVNQSLDRAIGPTLSGKLILEVAPPSHQPFLLKPDHILRTTHQRVSPKSLARPTCSVFGVVFGYKCMRTFRARALYFAERAAQRTGAFDRALTLGPLA
jgi:hypothetical protein